MEQKVCANLECGHDRCPVKCKFFLFLSLVPRIDRQTWLFVYDMYMGFFADFFFLLVGQVRVQHRDRGIFR